MALSEFYDKKQERLGEPPNPVEMGVEPPRRFGFVDATEIRRKISSTCRKINRLLKKYERGG